MNFDIIDVFKRASLSRNFENYVYKKILDKTFNIPIYLSAGQEFISASIASYIKRESIDVEIFIQHRGHSTYLSFDADPVMLIDELLGLDSGCSKGMGGSASIQSFEQNIYGHDGLMGSQVPIAVGHCYETRKPTIVFVGDAAVEEDYAIASLGWASTKNLPILFIVEDNNLSILTEKKIRRNWEINNVASAFGIKSKDINDDPVEIFNSLDDIFCGPKLLNIRTNRKYWHAGAGIDGESFDRYEEIMKNLGIHGQEIHSYFEKYVEELWAQRLETL